MEDMQVLIELLSNTNLYSPFTHWAITWPVELTGELVTLALLSCFVALSRYELRSPKETYATWQIHRSYQTNLSLFAFNSIFVNVISLAALLTLAERNAGNGFLSFIPNPAVKALLSFLAVDLLLYGWHRACHRFGFLWLFHRVNHSDRYLNVSTAFRVHFLEIFTTTCLKAGLILLLGIDKMSVLAIEALILGSMMFHHTNARFKFERLLGNFITVPILQRMHHSAEPKGLNHNYGFVLSIWDRLFGTFSVTEYSRVGFKGRPPEKVLGLIRFGFGWEDKSSECPANLDSMIAEAAYYKAEKRNFRPGHELLDWLEAKTEVLKNKTNQT
jgi:sterol desaturase/sphingolipid hydroxylase (fatty acid hydroxylase superfamily)